MRNSSFYTYAAKYDLSQEKWTFSANASITHDRIEISEIPFLAESRQWLLKNLYFIHFLTFWILRLYIQCWKCTFIISIFRPSRSIFENLTFSFSDCNFPHMGPCYTKMYKTQKFHILLKRLCWKMQPDSVHLEPMVRKQSTLVWKKWPFHT